MIRRHVGSAFYLITQNAHAVLAEELGRRFGNAAFAKPEPFASTLRAIGLHDCGWPIHDDQPTLNAQGYPLDVFDSLGDLGLKLWSAGADRTAEIDPYSGLLVSLHVLALSMFMLPQTQGVDPASLALKFAVNKFQHQEIERQEKLRRQLGMSTERPLHFGLAQVGAAADEDRLHCNFRLLQAMDLISLALCCTQPPVGKTQDVFQRPGGPVVRLLMQRETDDTLQVHPWPFDSEQIELTVPCRVVTNQPFANNEAFHEAYAAAKVQELPLRLRGRR